MRGQGGEGWELWKAEVGVDNQRRDGKMLAADLDVTNAN